MPHNSSIAAKTERFNLTYYTLFLEVHTHGNHESATVSLLSFSFFKNYKKHHDNFVSSRDTLSLHGFTYTTNF